MLRRQPAGRRRWMRSIPVFLARRFLCTTGNSPPEWKGSLRRRCRVEPLEQRLLFSVVPELGAGALVPISAGASDSAHYDFRPVLQPVSLPEGRFFGSGNTQQAVFSFHFDTAPQIEQLDTGSIITLDGESSWTTPGDPVVPVRSTTILLPPGMEVVSAQAQFLNSQQLHTESIDVLATPVAVTTDDGSPVAGWGSIDTTALEQIDPVRVTNHVFRGYRLATLDVFPVVPDSFGKTLNFHSDINVVVTVGLAEEGQATTWRPSASDWQLVAATVANPDQLDQYPTGGDAATYGTTGSAALPDGGPYQYVIITSADLQAGFQPLIQQKQNRGISAGIVTTEYIQSNYAGTETGDLADRIRQFIADAYTNWGTEWILLGGDSEVVPQRGVYASVGGTVDSSLPTDMYYACLDGPWNADGDSIWAEATDGAGGGDVDLYPDVYVGRAPVSNTTEVANFVAKTVWYETNPHPNATTAVWLGEKLDDQTYGSYSGIPIAQQTIPDDWNLIEHYDSTATWSGSDLLADLNASPHFVNHLGHTNEVYNARLLVSDVAGLTNSAPYFMYSQGCYSGAFDLRDVSIAEQHVVGQAGAFGTVMNSRYGWYAPGSTPAGSHYYAMEFWDAVFNEGLNHMGQANHDSKVDNLFRVGSTGVYRWIHFETTLFGDPETPFQVGWTPDPAGSVSGSVWDDTNGDGQHQSGEAALQNQVVYIDQNGNGRFDENLLVGGVNDTAAAIPDASSLRSEIAITGGATVVDVNLTLDITHPYVNDLEAYLISPNGTRVALFQQLNLVGENFSGTTFDDEATTPIGSGSAPFTGSYRPEQALAQFDGEDASGTWILEIVDKAPLDTGTLNSWSLEIVTEEPSVLSGADGSFQFAGLSPGQYVVRVDAPEGKQITAPDTGAHTVTLQAGQNVDGVDFLVANLIPADATDLGTVDFVELTGIGLNGQARWYALQTAHDAYLTVDALLEQPTDTVDVSLYNGQGQLLAESVPGDSCERLDYVATAGTLLYLRLDGSANSLVVRVGNLVAAGEGRVDVFGTAADDRFDFAAAAFHQVTINQLHYQFDSTQFTTFTFEGNGGDDTAVLVGSDSVETARMEPTTATFGNEQYEVTVRETADIIILGQGGDDQATLFDSTGDDVLNATPDYVELFGTGFYSRVDSFRYVYAYSQAGGEDSATLRDSAGDDKFTTTASYGVLEGSNYYNRAVGFAEIIARATAGGNDSAKLYDSAGNETFLATATYAKMSGNGWNRQACGFDLVQAFATAGGNDVATLYDSAGDDALVATATYARLRGNGFYNQVSQFDQVFAYATGGGYDSAWLYDSAGGDTLLATPTYGLLYSDGFYNRAAGFDRLVAYSTNGGDDTAVLYDSAGNDRLVATSDYAVMWNNDFYNRAAGFRYLTSYATAGGADTVKLYDSAGDDILTGDADNVHLYGQNFDIWAVSFRYRYATASTGGNDRAYLDDTSDNDSLEASGQSTTLSSAQVWFNLQQFERVRATSSNGGTDTKHVTAVDFLLETVGDWADV